MDTYCRYCGAKLESGKYCPTCGAPIAEPEAPKETNYESMGGSTQETSQTHYEPKYEDYSREMHKTNDRSGLLIGLSIVFALTGLVLAAIGVMCMLLGNDMLNALINSDQWAEIVKTAKDAGMTESELKSTLLSTFSIIGLMFAVPGVLGLASGICGFMKKAYTLGLVTAIIYTVASALTFLVSLLGGMVITIIMPIIGIVFIVLWTKTKDTFE